MAMGDRIPATRQSRSLTDDAQPAPTTGDARQGNAEPTELPDASLAPGADPSRSGRQA